MIDAVARGTAGLVLGLFSGLVSVTPAAEASAAWSESPSTRLVLKVKGCEGCRVWPVQNVDGGLAYEGKPKRVRDGKVRFTVPTSRTQSMAFLVFAPFDDYARAGIPMVVVTAFKTKDPGDRVGDRFARGAHKGSGCWSGTTEAAWRSTLVVKKRKTVGLYGQGTATVAAGYLRRTEPSQRYWRHLKQSIYHASDPSICA